MDEMKTTVRTLTFSTNYVLASPFASKSGGHDPQLLCERRPCYCGLGLGFRSSGINSF